MTVTLLYTFGNLCICAIQRLQNVPSDVLDVAMYNVAEDVQGSVQVQLEGKFIVISLLLIST